MPRKFSRETIYFIFFIFLLLNLIADRYTNIYPSLVFPSFARAPLINNEAHYRVTELFGVTADGKTVKLNEDSVFYEIDYRYSRYILGTILKRVNNKKDVKGSLYIKNYFKTHLDSVYNTGFKGVFIIRGERTYYLKTGKLGNEIADQHASYIPLN
ncbi:MAG: hypothetical protein ABIO55_07995 [Ginsengibacter sp.]